MKTKHGKYKRKVILIKHNDMQERIILTKTVKKRTKKVPLEVKYDTKITTIENSENYSLLKARSYRRIVPCCLRPGCKNGFKYKEARKRHEPKRRNHTPKVYKKKTHKVSYRTISSEKKYLDSEHNNNLIYENISSDPFTSSYTDEELENLMKSTRKRMRDSDEEWTLHLKRPRTSTPLRKTDNKFLQSLENINSSFDSLNTLVLEADIKNNINNSGIFDMNISPIMSPGKLEAQEEDEKKPQLNPLFLSQDLYNKDKIKKEYYESDIDKVIIKLENNDSSYNDPKINNINFSIKQELYGDL